MNQSVLHANTLQSRMAVEARSAFIAKTYIHLAGAMAAFTLIEVALFESGLGFSIARAMLGVPWLVILGAFMLVSWMVSRVVNRVESPAMQYAALGAFVVAEALLFVPMLAIAIQTAPGVATSAATVTLLGFGALTGVAMLTRKDFSFMRAVLMWGGVCALLLIVASLIFGFQLGTWFSVGMVAFAGGAILYDTSNVLHHYREDQHVAAAVALFASVALLFWYVLRLFLSRR